MSPRPALAILATLGLLAATPVPAVAHASVDGSVVSVTASVAAGDSWLCEYFKNLPGCPIKKR